MVLLLLCEKAVEHEHEKLHIASVWAGGYDCLLIQLQLEPECHCIAGSCAGHLHFQHCLKGLHICLVHVKIEGHDPLRFAEGLPMFPDDTDLMREKTSLCHYIQLENSAA